MTRVRVWLGGLAVLVLALAWAGIEPSGGTEPLVVYSARKEELLKPVVDGFERATGIRVRRYSPKSSTRAAIPSAARSLSIRASKPAFKPVSRSSM